MGYKYDGVDIQTLCEIQHKTDARTDSGFSDSNYLYAGSTYMNSGDHKFIQYAPGYIYSKQVLLDKFYKNGTAIKFAEVGCRPSWSNLLWSSSNTSTYYINMFIDGSVWIATALYSASSSSRVGTCISTKEEKRKYFFYFISGGGGGGAGGNGTNGGGGGAGGSYGYGCFEPRHGDRIILNYTGTGGTGGTGTAESHRGGAGSSTQIYRSASEHITAPGGGGGWINEGGTAGGYVWGSGIIFTESSYRGGNGGGGGDAGAGVDSSSYAGNPENSTLSYSSRSGGSGGYGSGGGAGALSNGANGAGSGGVGNNGSTTAGGSGGAWVLFGGKNGGNGGYPYAALYY